MSIRAAKILKSDKTLVIMGGNQTAYLLVGVLTDTNTLVNNSVLSSRVKDICSL